jgi:hypothetical protein
MRTLSEDPDFTPARLCEEISSEVIAFAGAEGSIHDDRTLLVVRFLSNQTGSREYELQTAMAEIALK